MDEYLRKQGERIRRARRYLLLSQTDLAEKLTAELGERFNNSKLSRIEKGTQDVTGHELHALSVVLQQPVPWLQGVEDDGFDSQAKGVYLNSFSRPLLKAA